MLPRVVFAQSATAADVNARKAQLQAQLDELQKEIDQQNTILQGAQRQATSLERDVAVLDAQISKAKLSIRSTNLSIQELQSEINAKQDTIDQLGSQLEQERQSLADLLRKTGEIDNYSLVEVVLANQDISSFFQDLDAYHTLQAGLQQTATQLKSTQATTEQEKSALEDQYTQEQQLKQEQQLEQQRLQQSENDKNQLLAETKGQESKYQEIIASKKKTAAQIRTELFTLQGSAAIPFDKALEYANDASKQTGVRPAFILGIIAEESDLGANVGTGTWTVDMNPTRDQPVFQKICAELGLDPNKMPVSKKPWYGWGGAMGPAQFIPSTWVLYEDRIAKLTGDNPPNPWNPKDAFMASAILLMDNGADKGGFANERLAALRYLAGWKNASKPEYSFYGDDVMNLAAKYQDQIDILNGS